MNSANKALERDGQIGLSFHGLSSYLSSRCHLPLPGRRSADRSATVNVTRTSIALVLLSLAACVHMENHSIGTPEAELIENFRRDHAEFVVANAPAQFTMPAKIRDLKVRQTLSNLNGMQLQLMLGKRRIVKSNGIFRTGSRYQILGTQNRVLAVAESVLATEDIGQDGECWVTVFTDAETNSFLIAEKQSWATDRYIVIHPAVPPQNSENDMAQTWAVQYVRIPQRGCSYGLSDPPNVLGIFRGRVYFLEDGKIYAIPFDNLEREKSLEYSIG